MDVMMSTAKGMKTAAMTWSNMKEITKIQIVSILPLLSQLHLRQLTIFQLPRVALNQ